MENVKFYLAGAMTGLSLEEQFKWRNQVINAIRYGDYDYAKNPIFFSPPVYYNEHTNVHKSEREVMEYDLYNLRKSDVVVVNFDTMESSRSIGTAMELALAKEYHKPVVALNKIGEEELHPWIRECVTRQCESMVELVRYLVEYYLN